MHLPLSSADTLRDRGALAASLAGAAIVVWALPQASDGDPGPPGERIDVSAPEARTTRVYPEDRGAIRFSHDAHADTPCSRCHGSAADSRSSRDDLRPDMEVCATCHRNDASPSLSTCSGCHDGYDVTVEREIERPEDWRSVRPAPMVPPSPDARLHFDHARHLELLGDGDSTGSARADGENADSEGATVGSNCRTCHNPNADGAPTMPSMGACLECHSGQSDGRLSASGACETCHPSGALEAMRANDVTPPEASSAETSWLTLGSSEGDALLTPPDHDGDWLQRHGSAARARGETCTDCHTEQDCSTCHDESVASPSSVHPPNFEVAHAIDARARRDECTECHSVDTFCTQCHERAEVVPTSRDEAPRTANFHPPDWVEPGAPGNHAVMARRNITDCASCHTEQDCVSCHQGVNPHPPDFRATCRRLLEANPGTCTKCHQNRSRLERMCL